MDIKVFAMICIATVRLVGFMVVTDLFLRFRERILLWIAAGWLVYALSPLFELIGILYAHPFFDFLYVSLALEGMLMLVSGAIWIFRKFSLSWAAAGEVGLFILMLLFYMLGLSRVVSFMVPALQFLALFAVSVISFLGYRSFYRVGGNSIYWLLATFIAGAMQAGVFVFIPAPQLPALIYVLTVLISVLSIIFFMHLEHNITLHRQHESESRYRLIVENQSDLIVKLDMAGRLLYANPRYCAMFAQSQKELLGRVITRHTFNESGEADDSRLARQALFHEPYACYVEERTETAFGWRWLAWSEKTVFDANQNMLAIVAVGRDISEQKEAAAEIRRLNQELEQRVSERTAQLETLNRELETFTYSVSHDLKAPLRGIEGFSQILLNEYAGQLDGEGKHYLENVVDSVQHMRTLIDDLLAYSKLDRRTQYKQQIIMSELVNELLAEHSLELEQRGVQVNMRLERCVFMADRETMRQALGNLIDNAIKYSKYASPSRIEVGYEYQTKFMHLWVRDNGIGFEMENQNKIFELFQRLHSQEEYAGTGVGLAIVQKAVQRMDGRIRVESAPGQGATFTLELPL